MNAVEIEEAVSTLAAAPFDPAEFPFAFLAAFGMKDTTVKRLRTGVSNASDVPGAILQRNNIHLAVAPAGQAGPTLDALRASPKTSAAKAKFILATDGDTLLAEDRASGEPLACPFADLPQHFGFFLPLAGISTVAEIKNNPIDVKATGRLNKLYVELLKDNPDWATGARRPALNQLMARLIFCFFAEDTGIFHPSYHFTPTVERMSDASAATGPASTHEVIGQLFRAMGTPTKGRAAGNFRPWADGFPYVNGGLFTRDGDCPRFSKIARAYLLSAGKLDWREINPDIFGSMIQAVADDQERGALGMHYTSVPNILKVLNPLFLDDLRAQLDAAGTSLRKLRTLRRRLSAIRVFDPACGSGNFLVIAYLHMRAIEAEIVSRTNDDPKSCIRLDNFYGIEIKGFAAEIARLALLIAEFQADCRHISQQEARMMVLPLHKTGQITVGNALRLDWLTVCPPATKALVEEWDLGGATGRLALEDNGLGDAAEPETFICGNPPYKGSAWQTELQKEDLRIVSTGLVKLWRSLDYVAGWFLKSAQYLQSYSGRVGLVSTNSVFQGEQVSALWPTIYSFDIEISFAHCSFKWSNLASNKAGVTVVVAGLEKPSNRKKRFYNDDQVKLVDAIGPYLVPGSTTIVERASHPSTGVRMLRGNMPTDGGNLIMSKDEAHSLIATNAATERFVRPFWGGVEIVNGVPRYCLWIEDDLLDEARAVSSIHARIMAAERSRALSDAGSTRSRAHLAYKFMQIEGTATEHTIAVAAITSEQRPYLPATLLDERSILSNKCYALYDAPIWAFALIASRIHIVWIATVCGRMKTDFSYSNTLGWNTFPVPTLTTQDKANLTTCAENILLAREAHFPATIADLYDPEAMPEDLRRAHDANDETLERIYIGRRFRNDTERLERLFDLYTKMTAAPQPAKKAKRPA